MKKENYYRLDRILEKNADYNIIIGERSNGKSYAVLEKILIDFIKSGYNKQGVYLRRLREDITSARMKTLFTPFNIEKYTKGKYTTIIFTSNSFYLGNIDDKGKFYTDLKKPFLFTQALTDTEHNKSTSYPDVCTIFFDEFLTRQFYLKNEFILLMNSLSTIIRDRNNVKIFLCGNTVNSYSPYFEEFGLSNIKKQKQGTIDLYRYGTSDLLVAVEYCDNIQSKKKSDKYFAFNNPSLQMIKSGKWEVGIYPHLQDYSLKDKDIIFYFLIRFNGDVIQLNVICDDDIFVYVHRKTTEIKDTELLFDLDNKEVSKYRQNNIMHCNIKGITKTLDIIRSGKIYYSSNEVGEILRNYSNSCKVR